MSDSQVDQNVSIEAIVQRVAELRALKAELRRRISTARQDMSQWGDDIDMDLARAEADVCEEKVTELDEQILEQARRVTEPHPLWPGGWLIEEIGQLDEALRWIVPSARWDVAPETPGARRRAWRTRAAAQAAVPTDGGAGYRVVWSPIGKTGLGDALDTPLDAASLDETGSPRIRVRNHFDGLNPWTYLGGTPEFVYVVALPTPEVQGLADEYAPVLDDQPALAAVPREWLHVKLWLDPGYFKSDMTGIEEKLAERVLLRRPDITPDAVNQVLAALHPSAEDTISPISAPWEYYCEMEALLRGSSLPARRPTLGDWEALRNAGPDVPTYRNWEALPLVNTLRRELLAEAQQPVLDSFATHFADQPPVQVTAGPAIADDDGVQLDLMPDARFQALIDRCETWPHIQGRREQKRHPQRATLPIAYSTADEQVDLTGLYNVRHRVTWSITELAVVAIRRYPQRGHYTWTELSRVPLRRN